MYKMTNAQRRRQARRKISRRSQVSEGDRVEVVSGPMKGLKVTVFEIQGDKAQVAAGPHGRKNTVLLSALKPVQSGRVQPDWPEDVGVRPRKRGEIVARLVALGEQRKELRPHIRPVLARLKDAKVDDANFTTNAIERRSARRKTTSNALDRALKAIDLAEKSLSSAIKTAGPNSISANRTGTNGVKPVGTDSKALQQVQYALKNLEFSLNKLHDGNQEDDRMLRNVRSFKGEIRDALDRMSG